MAQVEKSFKKFGKNEIIIKEGDQSNGEIYFLRKGQAVAEVVEKFVGTINEGEFFGEVAAILGGRRGASVRALVTCHVDVFNGVHDDKLQRIMKREPRIGKLMMTTLAKRLQETSVEKAAEVANREKVIERFRKAISGSMYALENLTEVYKAPYLQELLDQLSQNSGIQLGSKRDADENILKSVFAIIRKADS